MGTTAAATPKKKEETALDKATGGPGAHGIAGFSLDSAGDRIAAIDYTGSGHLDHLLLYGLGTRHYHVVRCVKKDNSYEFMKIAEA